MLINGVPIFTAHRLPNPTFFHGILSQERTALLTPYSIGCLRGSTGAGGGHVDLDVLGQIVLGGGLDGILGQHRAVQLHGRKLQVRRDVGVLDGHALLDGLALQPLRGHRR